MEESSHDLRSQISARICAARAEESKRLYDVLVKTLVLNPREKVTITYWSKMTNFESEFSCRGDQQNVKHLVIKMFEEKHQIILNDIKILMEDSFEENQCSNGCCESEMLTGVTCSIAVLPVFLVYWLPQMIVRKLHGTRYRLVVSINIQALLSS